MTPASDEGARPRFEILPGFTANGPRPVSFAAESWFGSWSGHSEGLVVRFFPASRDPWVGNFQPGPRSSNLLECGAEHPDGLRLIIVARSWGYLVDPEACKVVQHLGAIHHLIPIPEHCAIVIGDGLSFTAIRRDGIWWQSDRISWDEVLIDKIEGKFLHGRASSPSEGEESWSPFMLDLLSGKHEGGSFATVRLHPIRRPTGR